MKKYLLIFLLIILTYPFFSQDSRLPKESTNWLQNAVPDSNGDIDQINVIFFEIPDTITSTLYFAVNDPGADYTTPDAGGDAGETTDFYLVGGTGCLSNTNSKLIDYTGIEAQARTGSLLDNYTADNSAAYNIDGAETSEWIYFSGVSPSQGEHIGDKYYFKVVVHIGAGNFKNAYQVDISTSNTATTPTSIPGVRTFAYNWCMCLQNSYTWDIYPYVPDGATGNIRYFNFDFDSAETGFAYDKSNNSLGGITESPDSTTSTNNFAIGTETSGTWRLEIIETNGTEPDQNTSEIWFSNSVSGEYYRAYSSSYIAPDPDAVTLTYDDGIAVADNTDLERVIIQIIDSSGNPVPYSRDIYITVDNAGIIDSISTGTNNGTNALITTDNDGLGYLDVRKASPDGIVNVRAYWDTTGGSDSFGTASNSVIHVDFQVNPEPELSSTANKTFDVGDPATGISGITVTHQASTANITAANDIFIRIPSSLDCIFNTSITNLTGNITLTGTGSINTTIAYEDNTSTPDDTIIHIDVTGDFGSDSVLTINTNTLQFMTFSSTSSGQLELSYDGGNTFSVIDDKEYYIGDFNILSILARETADLDSDGYIDAILLTFSDDINDTTVTATDFLIAGSAGTGVNTGTTVDDNKIYILFADGVLLTDSTPTVQFIGVNSLQDTGSNYLATEGSSTNAVDRAGPAILSAFASDETILSAIIDNDDTVTITWSENTNQPAINNGNIDSLLVLNNGHSWLDGAGNITSAVWTGTSVLVITFSTGGSVPDIAVGDTITIDDSLFNDGSNYSTAATFSSITGSFDNDTTPPDISTIVTADMDGDGYIDRLIVTFDENIDETSLVSGNFSVSAGTIDSITDDGVPENAVIRINLIDGVLLSDQTPAVTITAGGIDDLSGNSNNLINNFASTDNAGPAIISAAASDQAISSSGIDDDDTVTITFSENTNQPAINNGNIDTVLVPGNTHSWLDSGGNITSAAWSSASVLVITFSTGGGIPDIAIGDTITLNGTTITDGTNNSSTSPFSAITGSFDDIQGPDMSTITTEDTDGDGYIDRLILTWDENVDDTTITAGNFSVSAGTISNIVDDGTSNDAVIYINLNDGALLSDQVPSVTITSGGIQDIAGNNNTAVNNFASTDAAGPAIISAAASDETITANNIDADDTVTITFSENTNQPVIDNTNIDTVLALNNSHSWLDGAGNIGSAAWTDAKTLVITFSIGSGIPDTSIGDTITLNGTAITDGTNNSSTTAFSNITGTFDAQSPGMSSIITADMDGDGYIDRLILTWDENVDDSTITAGNFSVSAGTITGVVDNGTSNDDIIWINLTDNVLLTDQVPDVSISTGGIQDLTGNDNTAITNFASTDSAGPAIISAAGSDETIDANGIDDDDTVTITFSENTNQPAINNGNIDTVLVPGNTHSWLDSGGNITSAAWSSASVLVITFSTGGGIPDIAIGDTITLDGTTITDGTNNSSTVSFSAITGSFDDTQAPDMSTITTEDTDGDGYIDRLILTWDENVDDTTITAGNFSVSAGTILNIVDDGTSNDAVIYINLNDGALLSDQVPSVTITSGGIQDIAGNNNTAVNNFASTDAAGPAILSAAASDESVYAAGVDSDDTMTVTFSENTNQPVIDNTNIDTVLALNNGHSWLDGAGNITSAVWTGQTILVITFSDAVSTPDIDIGDTITLDGTTITDSIPNNSGTTAFSPITGNFFVPVADPVIVETRAVPGNNIIYVEFNVNVYTDGASNPIIPADFNYDDSVSSSGLSITNIQTYQGADNKFIFTLSGDLTKEFIVNDTINANTNEVYNSINTAMDDSINYQVSDIGINFFSDEIMEDLVHKGKDWHIDTFDGSEDISPDSMKVEAEIYINDPAFIGLTPKLYYKTFTKESDAKYWDPDQTSGDKSITGSYTSGNTWKFIIPENNSINDGDTFSFVFKIGSFYCYRSKNSSPVNVETYYCNIKTIKQQNNNVTILNNVINPHKGEKTVLYYIMEDSGPVSIAVYDLKSDLVKILENSTKSSGNHTVSWNGKNENGKIVTRGVYFIRIRAPGIFNQIRKVLIIK